MVTPWRHWTSLISPLLFPGTSAWCSAPDRPAERQHLCRLMPGTRLKSTFWWAFKSHSDMFLLWNRYVMWLISFLNFLQDNWQACEVWSASGRAASGRAWFPRGPSEWRRMAPPPSGAEEQQGRERHQVHGPGLPGLWHVHGMFCYAPSYLIIFIYICRHFYSKQLTNEEYNNVSYYKEAVRSAVMQSSNI